MKRPIRAARIAAVAAAVAGAVLALAAQSAPLASNPIAVAVKRSDCDKAIELVKSGAAAKDPQALFLGGRMLDEGICVMPNPQAAAQYYELAAGLGDKDASLEYAAKVGLGEGAAQDYARAGDLCHAAGLDPQAKLSGYALGYACTLRSAAATRLRVTLPAGAFKPGTGPTQVEFDPAVASTIRIVSTPKVARGTQASVGHQLADPLVDADRVIKDAWKAAVAKAPEPDRARLGGPSIELSLDTDTPLENGPPSDDPKLGSQSSQLPFAAKLFNSPVGSGH